MNQLNTYYHQDFTCDKCGDKFSNKIAYSYAPNLDQSAGYEAYCANCVKKTQEKNVVCSFFDPQQEEMIFCEKPIFN
jgi:hypothetical protein